MVEKLPPAGQQIPALREPVNAPLIYFEFAPNFGFNNGVANIVLAASCMRPDGQGHVVNSPIVVADLRCNLPAAINLREALDHVILMAQTPQGQPN